MEMQYTGKENDHNTSLNFRLLFAMGMCACYICCYFHFTLFMDLRDGAQWSYLLRKVPLQIARCVVVLLWNIIHFLVSIWYLAKNVMYMFESYLISYGLLKKYESIDVSKVRYLAIVLESEEARHIPDVIELLWWVAAIGVKRVCLYDMEGVLKESKEAIIAKCSERPWKEGQTIGAHLDPGQSGQLTLEFVSVSDGKEGVARAANLLFLKYQGDQDRPRLTESHLSEALQLVGCSGPEPDLLLVYGPVRCHLGFPAWRLRYTEIVHMGSLKSKKYGSLIKAIYKFTTVCQNYGK